MNPQQHSRRSLLRAGGIAAATLATGSLAGCIDSLGGSSGGGDSSSIDDVPPEADAVFTADVNTLLADDGVRTTYNAFLEARAKNQNYDGPETLTATLDQLATQYEGDVRDLSRVTAFFSLDDRIASTDPGTGILIDGNWSESAMLSTVNTGSYNYEESTYNGYTIHEASAPYALSLGVLEDGRYVVSNSQAVRAVLDVASGETSPVDGPVADAYRNTDGGPIRFATTVKSGWVPSEVDGKDGTIDLSAVEAIESVGGSIYRDGNVRGSKASLNAPDGETAKKLEDVITTSLSLASTRASNAGSPEFVVGLFEEATVSRNGNSVDVSVELTVTELEKIATQYGKFFARLGGGMGGNDPTPIANFDGEYDADAGTVTLTHQSGNNIPADKLSIRGEGFADAAGADMTSSGQWAGGTSDGTVSAGDSVVVGVQSDYQLRVVWTGENSSTTIDEHRGPDA